MTESLQARWAHLLSILSSDPNVTARQRGFVNLARPQGLMGSSRLIIEVPNKLTRAVFEEQITAPFRAALHEAFGPTTTALFDVNETMVPNESAGQDVNEPEQAASVEPATVAAHQVPAEPSDYPGGAPYAEPTHREAPHWFPSFRVLHRAASGPGFRGARSS